MPLRPDLLNPIPGDNPSGSNYRYHPDTDKLKEARREDADVPQGAWKTTIKTADYASVIKLAGDIIANRSKDLQIAVWLVEAHLKKEGFGVLAPSFAFLQGLLSQFWDTLYPELEDGEAELRAAPLDWIGSKLEGPLKALPLVNGVFSYNSYHESRRVGSEADVADDYQKQQDRQARIAEGKITAEQFDEAFDETRVTVLEKTADDISGSLESLEALGEFCDAQFGDFAPSFTKTHTALEEVGQTLRILINRKGPSKRSTVEEVVDEDQFASIISSASAPPVPADDVPDDTSFSVLSSDVIGDSESESEALGDSSVSLSGGGSIAPSDRDDVVVRLTAICKYLRERDASEVPAYAVIRGYRFGELRNNTPPVIYSMLDPPPSEVRLALKKALNDADWLGVLEVSEAAAALPCGRGWLDLHRYAVTALQAKGFYAAATSIASLVRGLVQDLPDLVEMNLLDDTAVANPETKAWVEKLLAPPAPEVPAEETSSDGSTEESTDSDSSLGLDGLSSDTDSLSLGEASDDAGSLSSSADLSAAEAEAPLEPTAPAFALDSVSLEPVPEMIVMDEVPEPDAGPDVFETALDAARDGRLPESVGMLVKSQARERSNRARFKRKAQIAHLLVAGERPAIAQPILEEMMEEIVSRRLEDWEEMQLLAYPIELLMRCLGQSDATRKRELYQRLCKLDPLRAMDVFADHG